MASVSAIRLRTALPLSATDARVAVVTVISVLVSFGATFALDQVADFGASSLVLAVVLTLTLGRSAQRNGLRERMLSFFILPAVAIVAGGVGGLMLHHAWIGDALFVVALSGAIWVRRFGTRWTRIGTIASLPFIAMLVAPAPVRADGSTNWVATAVVGMIAFVTVNGVQFIAERIGYLASVERPRHEDASGSSRSATSRFAASTRMALQMAVSLGIAFLAGHLLFGVHWPWMVLTVYIVQSGNRGRGDVVYKGIQRLAGALLGTLAATVIAGSFAPGDRTAIVLIFAIIIIATFLRHVSYAWWAGGVTASLALLYGFFGESGDSLVETRLAAIVLGAVLAVGVSWLLLPIRTTDVLRLRTAHVLATLSDFLGALRTDPASLAHQQERFSLAVAELERLAPPLEAHHRWQRIRQSHSPFFVPVQAIRRSADAVERIVHLATVDPRQMERAETSRMTGLVAANVGLLRKSIRTRVTPTFRSTPEQSGTPLADALRDLDASLPALAAFLAPNAPDEMTAA